MGRHGSLFLAMRFNFFVYRVLGKVFSFSYDRFGTFIRSAGCRQNPSVRIETQIRYKYKYQACKGR